MKKNKPKDKDRQHFAVRPDDGRLGNEFWKLAPTIGRKKVFETPEILWTAACEYFNYCNNTPLIEIDFRGKAIQRVEIPKMRAMSYEGLAFFLGVATSHFHTLRAENEKKIKAENNTKLKEEAAEFLKVLTRIDQIIFTQQYEGAAAGFLNPMIVARKLALREHQAIQIEDDSTLKSREDFQERINKGRGE